MRFGKWLLLPPVLLMTVLPSVALGQVAVGVKNFQQLLASYAAITGVDPGDSDISDYFAQSKTRLPKKGRVDELSSPALLTAGALGGLFCEKMIASDAALPAAQRRAHKQVDFTKAPAAALTSDVRTSVVGEYAGMFWQRSATATEQAALLAVFDESVTSGGTTPADTLLALRPVCGAVAGSLATLVN
jgi:hypothetical protein